MVEGVAGAGLGLRMFGACADAPNGLDPSEQANSSVNILPEQCMAISTVAATKIMRISWNCHSD